MTKYADGVYGRRPWQAPPEAFDAHMSNFTHGKDHN
jgi:hypothetical protein